MELGVVLTAVVADVAQSSAGLQQDLLVCGAEQLDEGRDEAGLHAGAPHELWQRQQADQRLRLGENRIHRTCPRNARNKRRLSSETGPSFLQEP